MRLNLKDELMKFSELNLPANIVSAVNNMGITEMTPIQEAAYPIITEGRDLWALAETGSGKTVACGIPMLQRIDTRLNKIQALVIVPTRELCIQYVNEISKLAKGSDVITYAVFGKTTKVANVVRLKSTVHILVATPGRLMDLMYDGVLDFPHVKMAILDEADELLKEGFLEDIEFILSCIHVKHQTLLFSATAGKNTKRLAKDILVDHSVVNLIRSKPSPDSISHWFQYIHPRNRIGALLDFLEKETTQQVIIFCDTRHGVERLFRDLKGKLKDIEYIHGALPQPKRTSIFNRFKRGRLKYMIATDVAGRGLDFSHVSVIINWDFPSKLDQYTHRTGRTGRMGRSGKAFSFIKKGDIHRVKSLISRKKIKAQWLGRNPLNQSPEPGKPRKKKRYVKNKN